MASSYDIVGLVLGALGMTAVVQLLYSYAQSRLPLQRIRALDDDLSETDALFHIAVRDGLVTDRTALHELEDRLLDVGNRAEALRVRAYTATTFLAQFRAYMGGLSRDIDNLHSEVTVVRANVSSKGEVGRKILEIQGQFPRRPSLNPLISHSIRSPPSFSSFLAPRSSPYMSSSLRPGADATGSSYSAHSVAGGHIRHRDTAPISAMPSSVVPEGSSQISSQPVDMEVLMSMVDTMNRNLVTLTDLVRAQQSAGSSASSSLAAVVEQSQVVATVLTEQVSDAHHASSSQVQDVAASTVPETTAPINPTADDVDAATEGPLL